MGQHITLSELSKSQGWPTDKVSLERLRKRLLARGFDPPRLHKIFAKVKFVLVRRTTVRSGRRTGCR